MLAGLLIPFESDKWDHRILLTGRKGKDPGILIPVAGSRWIVLL